MNELYDLIIEYERLVIKGNQYLQSYYSLNGSPLLAQRKGELPNADVIVVEGVHFSYHFHGMGCRFDFDSIIVEFDYIFRDFAYRGFEINKLFLFVESYAKSSSQIRRREIFNKNLSDLKESKAIISIEDDSIDTYDYIFNSLTG